MEDLVALVMILSKGPPIKNVPFGEAGIGPKGIPRTRPSKKGISKKKSEIKKNLKHKIVY
jgi:hypothetical protein